MNDAKPLPTIIQFKQEISKATNKKGILEKWMRKNENYTLHLNRNNHKFTLCFTVVNLYKECKCTNIFKTLSPPIIVAQSVAQSTPSNRSIIINDTDDQSKLSTDSSLQLYELLTSNNSSNYTTTIPPIALNVESITCKETKITCNKVKKK